MKSNHVIDILNAEKPMFHPKSGTQEIPILENYFIDGAKETTKSERTSYAIGNNVLHYISENVKEDHVTLETGAGYSTVVLASYAKKHIVCNPDITANALILNFLKSNELYKDNLEFLPDSSDISLPKIPRSSQIDFALIDGNHSYPFPIIDWHYIDYLLKTDGILLVDNTNINSVKLLLDYLFVEESYKLLLDIGVTSVFQKTGNRKFGWVAQEINKQNH